LVVKQLQLGSLYIQVATALLVAGSTPTFGRLGLHPLARTQASFKVLGYSYSCRRLTDGSFQVTHMSRDDHAGELIKFEQAMAV